MQPYSRQRPLPGPSAILGVLAFLSTFVIGTYALLLTNNMLLPRKIRPNVVISVILGLGLSSTSGCCSTASWPMERFRIRGMMPARAAISLAAPGCPANLRLSGERFGGILQGKFRLIGGALLPQSPW